MRKTTSVSREGRGGGHVGRGPALRTGSVAWAGTCLCLLLAGCAGGNRQSSDNADPLLGVGPNRTVGQPAPAAKPAANAAAPTGPSANPAAPPSPALSTSPPTATLAAGQPPRYDTDNSLRINTPPANPVRTSSNGSWQVADTSGSVRLPGVEPAAPRRDPVPAVPAGARFTNYEQAQAILAQRGVTWQRLESDPNGEWKFSCSIPNRQNKFISRTYEARGKDYLAAVHAVLEQIDKDRP